MSRAPAGEEAPRRWVEVRGTGVQAVGRGSVHHYAVSYQGRRGGVRQLTREAYTAGDRAVVLLYSRPPTRVVLVRQFRLPALVAGHDDGMVLELPGGRTDGDAPELAACREAAEETGYRISDPVEVFRVHVAPGLVADRVHLFAAEVDPLARASPGGGLDGEDEDLDVVEMSLEQAMAKVGSGEIADAAAIIMLQHLMLQQLRPAPA